MIFFDIMSRSESDNGKERDIFGITIPLHSVSYRSSFKLKNNYDVSFIIHPVTKTYKLAGKIKDEDATVRNERNERATPLGEWSRYDLELTKFTGNIEESHKSCHEKTKMSCEKKTMRPEVQSE